MYKSQSKFLAMGSLIIMGIGFILTLFIPKTLFIEILHGGFEAGLVGGLADWFAVTALFRHPFGLPIPHTALLPKNRERITKGIVSMVEDNWLSKSSIIEKMSTRITAEKLIILLENEMSSEKVKRAISAFFSEMVQSTNEEYLADRLSEKVKIYLLNLDPKKLLDSLIPLLIEHQIEVKGFDLILIKIKEWVQLTENRNKIGAATLKGLAGLKLDGLMQFALQSLVNMVSDEKMGQILSNLLGNAIENLQQEDNTLRTDLILAIREELNNLSRNQRTIETLESWKVTLVSQQNLTNQIRTLLTQLKRNLIDLLEDETQFDQSIYPYFMQLIEKLKSNPNLLTKLNSWLQDSVIAFIDKNHEKIGLMVKENLDILDDKTLTQLIENKVGNDIQWIRVNGAVCGFVIGVILSFF